MKRVVAKQAGATHDENGRRPRPNRTASEPPARSGAAERSAGKLISAGHCYLFVEELRARSIDTRAPLTAAGLTPEDVRLDHFLSEARFLLFLEAIAASCSDADLGLHAGQRLELGALDLLGILLRSSKDGLHAYDTYLRYGDLWRAARDVDVHMTAARVTVQHVPLALRRDTPRILVDMVLSRVVKVARMLRATATPTVVSFSYPEPADVRVHRRLFEGATLEFAAPASALVFAGPLDTPLAHHDAAVRAVVEPHVMRAAASAAPAPNDTVAIVRHLLSTQLQSHALSLRSVAEALERSERHLRRQLQTLGTSYHDLLEDIRRERAIAHRAAHPRDSGVRLSEELGFSEPSVFYRAFKRWTGMSWSSR